MGCVIHPINTSPIGIRFAKSIEKRLKNARFQEYHQKKCGPNEFFTILHLVHSIEKY